MKLRWRYSRHTRYHYLEDDKIGYVAVQRIGITEGVWITNAVVGKRFTRLKDAKRATERAVHKQLKRRSK